MTDLQTQTRQDDVLRLLDTRLACLLVDRQDGRALRPKLFKLREMLLQTPLDSATLDEVEAYVRRALPAGGETGIVRPNDRERVRARLRLVRR